jgi:two-component sensor histidine kinase
VQDRYALAPDVAAALERARLQIEALALTADELQTVLPDAVGSALREGLRDEAAPISRRLAEVKGLANQTIRRLERLEGDLLAERHARVDDLALLIDLIVSGWRGVDERLARLERTLGADEGAVVYRIEDRRTAS